MKRLLIALLAVAMIGVVTSQASADHYRNGCRTGYGAYGSYNAYRYTPRYNVYGSYGAYRPTYQRSYYQSYRPSYNRSYYSYPSYNRGYNRGGISIHFGF